TSICPGGSAILKASGATSYSWSPTTGLSPTTGSVVTATPSSATSYTVTGTTGSCTSQGVINIAISPTPTVLVNSATICIGDSAILKATGATTYSWTSATGLSATTGDSVKASPSSTTIYTVTGTAGCSATATATVTTISSPSITVTPSSNPICLGASSTLTATGASTYTWTADPTLSTTTNSVTVATPSLNNTSYTVSGSVGTCSAIPTVITISVTPNPTVTATSTVTCAGTATSLTASGATTYTWTPATGLSSATGSFVTTTPTTTSFYTVTGTDGNGCIGVNTATVTANPLPNVNAGLDVPVCKGGSVQLGATGADTYIWTPSTGLSANNVSNPTATPSVTTSYNVVGTNTLTGCTKTDNVQVTISSVNPVIIADPQTGEAPLTVGFTNGTTGATTYTWSYGNGSTQVTSTNVNTQTIYQNVGTYTVTLSAVDATGCPGQTSTVIIVTEGFSISIPNIFTPNGDAINDNFFVKSSGVSTMNIIIFDRWGLKMWESNSPTGMWDGKSGSADAKDGTYFYIIKVTDTKNVSTDYKGNITLIR
ncbi:MAG: gliding motility-associated C-terminal domain-containing protein, partial [Bacteroidia bacterium]